MARKPRPASLASQIRDMATSRSCGSFQGRIEEEMEEGAII
jgi:hypothetical protein